MAEILEWIDENGAVTNLDDGVNFFITSGRAGLWMPPLGIMETLTPGSPGSRLAGVNVTPRDIDLPFAILDDSYELEVNRARLLTRSLLYRAGAGKLRVTRADSSKREIAVVYKGGLDTAKYTEGSLKTIITFHAADPFWAAASAIVNTYLAGMPATFFPFFPLVLSSSEIFADAGVANPGDVEAWPVWTIHGPGSNPVLKNLTNGKTFSLTATLILNEYITIDTRPGHKSVVKSDGSDLFGDLTATSSLWPLASGDSSIRIEMDYTDANSQVVLSYFPRYLSE